MEKVEDQASGVRVAWLLQREADVPAADDWLSISEREVVARFIAPKRRRDWRLGRWTTKRALALANALGVDADAGGDAWQRLSIRADAAGVPYAVLDDVPVPWVLSISHSGEYGMCAIAPAGVALGCDIETVGRRGEEFIVDYFTPIERGQVACADAEQRGSMVTVIWSAKESALKALGLGLRLDTREVEVRLSGEPAADAWCPLDVRTPERTFRGWWQANGARAITLVAGPAPAVPRRLCTRDS